MVGSPRLSGSIDRRKYILALVSVPGLKGASLVKAAELKLPELYPGDPSACRWDYRRLKSRGREELLVAIVNLPRLERAGLYIPLFHAVDLQLHRRPTGLTLWEGDIVDTLIPSPEGGYSLTHLRGKRRDEADRLPANRRSYRGAFREKAGGNTPLRISFFLLIVAGLLFAWGTSEISDQRAELAKLTALRREHTARMEELKALEERTAPLSGKADVKECLPPPLPLIGLIAEHCPEKSRLISLDYSPDRSIGAFESPDALVLLKRLSTLSTLKVSLSGEVRSLPENANREEYRLLLEPRG